MQPRGACQVQKRLIQTKGFDRGGQILHHRADLARHIDIGLHTGFDDNRIRAKFQGLKHRHGRAHAPDARDIATRRYDATLAATDDHRLVGKAGIIALFNAGVKSIAIHMRDGE